MLNCDKFNQFIYDLSKTLNIDAATLKKVFQNVENIQEARRILADSGYKKTDIKRIIDAAINISPKYSTELSFFTQYAKLGHEIAKMFTSHTRAAINNAVGEGVYGQVFKVIDEALNSKHPATTLGIRIKELDGQLKKLKEGGVAEGTLFNRKWLEILSDMVQKHSGRELKKRLKDLKKQIEIAKTYYGLTKRDWSYTVINEANKLEKLPDGVFIKKGTLSKEKSIAYRLLNDSIWTNFRDVWNARLDKTYDAIKQLTKPAQTKSLNVTKKEVEDIIKKINNYSEKKLKVDFEGDLAIVSSDKGFYIVPLDDLSPYLEKDIRRYFMSLDEEFGSSNFADEIDNYLGELDEQIAKNVDGAEVDITTWVPDGMSVEEAKKALEHIQAEIHTKKSIAEDIARNIIDSVGNIDKYIDGDIKHYLNEYMLQYYSIKMFSESLLTNAELIKERSPELYDIIKKWNMFNDSVVKFIGDEYMQARKQISKKTVQEYKNNIPLYALREMGIEIDGLEDKIINAYNEGGLDLVHKLLVSLNMVDEGPNFLSKYNKTVKQLEASFNHDGIGAVLYLKNKYDGGLEKFILKLANNVVEYLNFPEEALNFISGSFLKILDAEKNYTTFLTKIRSTMQYVDHTLAQITGKYLPVTIGGSTKDSYFAYLLAKYKVDDKTTRRLVSDLYGESFWGRAEKLGKARAIAYQLLTNVFSPKGIGISAQNFIFQTIEGATLYKAFTDEAAHIISLLKNIKNKAIKKGLDEILWRGFAGDDIFQAESTKWLEEIRQPFYVKFGFYLDSLANSSTPSKILQGVFNFPAVADKMSDLFIARYSILNTVLHNLGLRPEELKLLIEAVEIGDKEAYRKLLNLINRIKEEYTIEYQQFFKAADHSGLTRNMFSRYILINFFSSWGSKKFGEYVFNLFAKPIKSMIFHTKIGGVREGLIAFIKTLGKEPRWHALLKQILIGADIIYNLDKNPNYDIEPSKAYLESLTISQAFVSFVVTRSISKFITDMSKDIDAPIDRKLLVAVGELVNSLSKNFIKEIQVLTTAPLSAAYAGFKTERDSKAVWYNMIGGLMYQLSNSALFGLFDQYGGVYLDRLDGQENLGLLESILGLPLTSWGEKKWDLYFKFKVQKALENPTYMLRDMWNISVVGNIFGMLNDYLDEEVKRKLKKDIWYNKILNERILPDEFYFDPQKQKTLYQYITRSDLLSDWSLDKSGSKYAGELQLVLKELEQQGINVEDLIYKLSQIRSKKASDYFKLLSAAKTKAAQSVLIAYVAQKEYQARANKNKKAPESYKVEKKGEILKKWLPILALVNKQVHTDMLGYYIKEKYKDDPIVSQALNGKLKNILMMRLLGEVVDSGEANLSQKQFLTIPVLTSKDVKEEKLPDFFNEMTSIINKLPISWQSKIVLKAGMLYANLDKAAKILKNWDEYGIIANKLAELIWDTNNDIQKNLPALESLFGGHSAGRQRIITPPKGAQLASKIQKGIRDLAKEVAAMPRFRNIILKKGYSKIAFKAPKFIFKPEIDEFRIKAVSKGVIRSKQLKTASKKLKPRRGRGPTASAFKLPK